MLTDNRVLIDKFIYKPTVFCEQKQAEKIIPTEEDFIVSNISSFGNAIGAITNRTTAQYEVQSRYEKNSPEYKELDKRIIIGQKIQQDCIDASKGIVCKPMPKYWYDRHSVKNLDESFNKDFQYSIIADRKPYFMRHVYPLEYSKYNKFVTQSDDNALMSFGKSTDQLMSANFSSLSEKERNFLYRYNRNMPVGLGDCTMNKICRRIEREFDGYPKHHREVYGDFDWKILQSGNPYDHRYLRTIKNYYNIYTKQVQFITKEIEAGNIQDDQGSLINHLKHNCMVNCSCVCPDESMLADIIIHICYKMSATKSFAWSTCRKAIVSNLLNKNNHQITFPTQDESGDIQFKGLRFSLVTVTLDKEDDNI